MTTISHMTQVSTHHCVQKKNQTTCYHYCAYSYRLDGQVCNKFGVVVPLLKSANLQYSRLVRWVDGPNGSCSKILCKNRFSLFFWFIYDKNKEFWVPWQKKMLGTSNAWSMELFIPTTQRIILMIVRFLIDKIVKNVMEFLLRNFNPAL